MKQFFNRANAIRPYGRFDQKSKVIVYLLKYTHCFALILVCQTNLYLFLAKFNLCHISTNEKKKTVLTAKRT